MPPMLRIVKPKPSFDAEEFLRSASAETTVASYEPRARPLFPR